MLGLLVAGRLPHRGRPGRGPTSRWSTPARSCRARSGEPRRRSSAIARLKRDGTPRGPRSSPAASRSAPARRSLLDEFPEVDAVLGTGAVDARVAPVPARHVLGRRRSARRRTRPAHAPRPGPLDERSSRAARSPPCRGALDAAAPRLPQDHRGLRPSLHVLHHPAPARRPAEPPARVAGGRGADARRARRAELNLIGQDTTGYGHRPAGPDRPRSPTCSRRSTEVDGLDWIRVSTPTRGCGATG